MQAVMKLAAGRGNVRICDIPEPNPGPGQIKLKVHAAGLCETDLRIYHDKIDFRPPVVLGCEVAGEIIETGPGVSGILLGARVTSETSFHIYDPGHLNLHTSKTYIGSEVNGGFAEYLVVPARNVHRLPENISYREGAITAPLACLVHSIMLTSPTIRVGDLAIIAGTGTTGLLTLQLLKASHATVIVLGTGKDSDQLALAYDLGADYVVNVETRDVHALVQDVSTQGLGADVVYECSGSASMAQDLLHLVRRYGRFVQLGSFGKPFPWDLDQVRIKELTVTGGESSTSKSWIRAIHLLENQTIKMESLITHDFMLSEWERAFEVYTGT